MFYLNGASFKKGLEVAGVMKVEVTRRGQMHIGSNVEINSCNNFNVIGRQQKMIFWVEGMLTIGDNVCMSATPIVCNYQITIGNNVTIGGNTIIDDADFQNLNPIVRANKSLDKPTAIQLPVFI